MEVAHIAERIARNLHAGQVDKQGRPYIEHIERVASAVDGDEAQAVAWLHDSLEDALTGEDGYLRLISLLQYEGVSVKESNQLVRHVDKLTRSEGETYEDYIEAIAASTDVVRRVKIADLRDNLRPCPGAERLHARYRKAIETLDPPPTEPRR